MGRHGTREQWVERVARFERSGEDAATFALREGVTKRLLLWWRWRLERDAEASTAAAPSSTPSGMSTSTALSFVRVDVQVMTSAPPVAPMLEVVLAGGRCVRVPVGFDGETLGRIVDVIEGGAR